MLHKELTITLNQIDFTASLSWRSYQDETRSIQIKNYETGELYGSGSSGTCTVPVGIKILVSSTGYLAFLGSYYTNIDYQQQEGMRAFSIIVPNPGSAFFYYIPVRIA